MNQTSGPAKTPDTANQFTLLFVDDEKKILHSLARLFKTEPYHILTARSAADAWEQLKNNTVHVIITDNRMPRFSGLDLLKKAKVVYPDTIRIMLTGYADTDSVMAAVNEGAVYKFITKPWDDNEIKLSIRLALNQYKLVMENRRLQDEQKRQIRNIDKLGRFMHRSRLGGFLVKKKLLSPADLKAAMAEQARHGHTLSEILIRQERIPEDQLIRIIETDFGIKPVRLSDVPAAPDLAALLPREICTGNTLVPYEKTADALGVAMADPTDPMKLDALKFMTGLTINPAVSSRRAILKHIDALYSPSPPSREKQNNPIESQDSIALIIDAADASPDFDKLLDSGRGTDAVSMASAIVAYALNVEASDIHIEPKSQYVMVRFRINGLLFDRLHLPLSIHAALVSRIKVISDLDISERRRPQDGRISVKAGDRLVDIRVSTLPTIAGEKIVFRILDRNSSIKDIEALGFSSIQTKLITGLIQKPQGCLLVTGPTGSGKTTTLYSLIQRTATIQKNYTTIEDPVEYYMEKIEQVMIKEKIGLTFPLVLKTLLRQDPDTIMLGEIRDFETAEVAFHAALTGHTVLSTLHTNSCIATLTRLLDMGIQSHILSASLNGIIAQRLVRKICPSCMVDDTPSEAVRALLGIDRDTEFSAKKGQGCDLCDHTGYHGRTGLYEVFHIGSDMEALIQNQATENQIKKLAVANGMETLIDNGLSKIAMGATTCEEVLRVLGPQNITDMTCPHCRKSLTERHDYCPFCLKALTRRCQGCGRPLEPAWNGCPDCGTKALPSPG